MNRPATFATGINCMDGRVQGAVRKYMRKIYDVHYVDKITDAGPVKLLSKKESEYTEEDRFSIQRLKKLLKISLLHHGSRRVAIAAHFGCGGNPASKKKQIKQLKIAKKTVEGII